MFIDAVMVVNYDPIKFGGFHYLVPYAIHSLLFLWHYVNVGSLIGQANGANNKELIARNVRGGIIIGFCFGTIIYFICSYMVDILSPLNFQVILTMLWTIF